MANEFKVRKGLVVNGSGSVLFDVQGSQGQLFSITDSLSGSLFSVKDISGIPVMEAFSDDVIKLGTFNREGLIVSGSSVRIGNSSANVHSITGSVGFNGSINVNNLITLGQTGNTSPAIYSFLNNGFSSPNPTGLNLGYFNYTTTQTGTQYHFVLTGNQFNPTSGDHTGLFYFRTFAPSSGTATFQSVLLRPTISQSSATGVTAGIIINPVLTSAADWRSIWWTNNTGFGLYGAGTAPNYLAGNLGIGVTSPTATLDVRGNTFLSGSVTGSDMLIRGSGNTFATNALTVQNSAGTNMFRIFNHGGVYFGAFNASIYPTTSGIIDLFGNNLVFQSSEVAGANYMFNFRNPNGAVTYTSGTAGGMLLASNVGYAPTSGTGVFIQLHLNPIINQTGGANGITRGLYVNPTLTRAADFRAIEWSNNAATAPSASWGLYGAGTAPNYLGGRFMVGNAPFPVYTIAASRDLDYGSGVANIAATGRFMSNVTVVGYGYTTYLSTQATSFTLPLLAHYDAQLNVIGATSGVTTQIGYRASTSLVGATNNYGFYGDIPSGTGRWNLYMNGTANNFLAGNLGIGVTSPTATLDVRGDAYISGSLSVGTTTTSYKAQIITSDAGLLVEGAQIAPFTQKIATFKYGANGNSINIESAAGKAAIQARDSNGISTMDLNINPYGGSVGINTTAPNVALGISGSFRTFGNITATSGSSYFTVSQSISQPAQTGSQVTNVNITPTLRYTAPNQTQTALKVAATFSGSSALSSSQTNIIADFGATSVGSQLTITDATSGSIYMVNDVSGIPIIEANSNWDVTIYDYPTKVLQKTGSAIIISGSLTIASGSNNDLYMYGHKMFNIGQFQNNSTLSGSANVSQSFQYDTTDFSEGVSLVSGSRMTVANAGYYNIQFSAQLQNIVNATSNVWIWFKKNGTNIPESATRLVLIKDEYLVAAWNFIYPANANDYFEIAWQGDSADVRILYEPASGNIPIIPSIITTVTQVR